jgi:hypothetical protein
MVETVDDALDLTISADRAIDPSAFTRIASTSYARLGTTQLHALGLPPTINRARLRAGRAVRALRPSPVAITGSPGPATEKAPSQRVRWRYWRSLSYWLLRPHLLPPAQLIAQRRGLIKDLGELVLLQVMGTRAIAAGSGSPFALLFAAGTPDVRVVLRTDVPASAHPLPDLPRDLSRVSGVLLDLADPWLVPPGIGAFRARRLEALSTALRARPVVGRGLLAGRSRWCDVFELKESAGQGP